MISHCIMINHVRFHISGRLCENPACKGSLHDTIINFGENLPTEELYAGFEHANQADL